MVKDGVFSGLSFPSPLLLFLRPSFFPIFLPALLTFFLPSLSFFPSFLPFPNYLRWIDGSLSTCQWNPWTKVIRIFVVSPSSPEDSSLRTCHSYVVPSSFLSRWLGSRPVREVHVTSTVSSAEIYPVTTAPLSRFLQLLLSLSTVGGKPLLTSFTHTNRFFFTSFLCHQHSLNNIGRDLP